MGMSTPTVPQNPTNQSAQQPQIGGKGGGKGSSMAATPASQANAPESMYQQDYRSTLQQGTTAQQNFGNNSNGNGKGASIAPIGLQQSNADQTDQAIPNNTTMSATSGQAQMGQPNPYPNTISSWDNSSNQQPKAQMGGKGKS